MKRGTRVLVALGLLLGIGACSAWCWLQTPAGWQWHIRYWNERRAEYLRGLAPADLRRVTLVCVCGDPDDPAPYGLILTPEKDRNAMAQIVSALRDIEPLGDSFQTAPTEWLMRTSYPPLP